MPRRRIVGICVIGQAPRPDTERVFQNLVPEGTRIVLRVCLDGLDRGAMEQLGPTLDADALYTVLPDGEEIRISKAAVVARAPTCLAALRDEGADVLVLNCTGQFPGIPGDAGVIFPSRLLAGIAGALVPRGSIGVFSPLAEQTESTLAKWGREGVDLHVETLVPSAGAAEAAEAGERMALHRPDLIAFDCMGYRRETQAAVREVANLPSLLAITVVGRVLQELLE